MRAVLLAAGVGRRLGTASPKILIELGGRTLLERHLENLERVGLEDVVIVTGFEREKLDLAISQSERGRKLEVSTAYNPLYERGSVLSVLAAAPALIAEAAPLLVMDGDVLYPPQMLERLIRSRHPTVLLLDRRCALDEADPVLVPLAGGRPVDFTKASRGPFEEIGESIGFFKLAAEDVPAWHAATTALAESSGGSATLEDVVRSLVREGRFGYEDVTGLPWIEIDFPEDLERAREVVLPAVEELTARWSAGSRTDW